MVREAFDMSFLKEYGNEVKHRLFIQIRSKDRLGDDLQGIPFLDFLDFAVTAHIDVGSLMGVRSSIRVNQSLLDLWGISKEQLFADAKENSPSVRPPATYTVGEALGMMGVSPAFQEEVAPSQLMVVTTEDFVNGSAVILYPGFLKEASRGHSLFLLPSSIHEFLYIRDDGSFTADELAVMVRDVNRGVVAEQEILSDHVYYYDAGKDEIYTIK